MMLAVGVAGADKHGRAPDPGAARAPLDMIAFDTNVLFPALETSHKNHAAATAFLQGLPPREVAICELVLTEIYVLVRNPVVGARAAGEHGLEVGAG